MKRRGNMDHKKYMREYARRYRATLEGKKKYDEAMQRYWEKKLKGEPKIGKEVNNEKEK